MSSYIAKSDIPWGGVLAYTRGQTITDGDAVKANGWEDLVVGENTKEAREIKAELTGRPVSEFETGSGTTTRTARSTSSDTAATEQKG